MNIVHGKSDKAKMDWFRDTAKRALADRLRPAGKGSKRRKENLKAIRDNWPLGTPRTAKGIE